MSESLNHDVAVDEVGQHGASAPRRYVYVRV